MNEFERQYPKSDRDRQDLEAALEDSTFLTIDESDVEPDPLGYPEHDPLLDSTESITDLVMGRSYLERTLGLPEPAPIFETEEAFNDFVDALKDRLSALGIGGASSIDEDSVRQLVNETYMDVDAVEDLYFWAWDHVKNRLGPFARVKFNYLLEYAPKIDPIRLQKEQDDAALDLLGKQLGFDMNDVLDARSSNSTPRRNLRRLAWLLTTEPALEDFSGALKSLASDKSERIKFLDASIRTRNVVLNALEGLRSVDPNTMDGIDQLWRRAEIQRLRHILALSQSIVDSANLPQ